MASCRGVAASNGPSLRAVRTRRGLAVGHEPGAGRQPRRIEKVGPSGPITDLFGPRTTPPKLGYPNFSGRARRERAPALCSVEPGRQVKCDVRRSLRSSVGRESAKVAGAGRMRDDRNLGIATALAQQSEARPGNVIRVVALKVSLTEVPRTGPHRPPVPSSPGAAERTSNRATSLRCQWLCSGWKKNA